MAEKNWKISTSAFLKRKRKNKPVLYPQQTNGRERTIVSVIGLHNSAMFIVASDNLVKNFV